MTRILEALTRPAAYAYQGQSGQQILGGVSRVIFSHLQTRKQQNSFLVIVYSGLFKNVIEALNLILEKYVAEI
jgi:hypothetical protein